MLDAHPAADLFPLMPDDELRALADDIAANGLNHPSMKALASLANGSEIPFVVAFYTREPWTFRVFRGNQYARKVYREDGRLLTEREFVASLYFLRNRKLEDADAETLAALDQEAA